MNCNTLHDVLGAHQEAIEAARNLLENLPARSELRQASLPQTFIEATQYVQTKEDERKKREAKKDKQKQRASATSVENVVGLIPGPPDTSAFWLVTEVRLKTSGCKFALTALVPTRHFFG